MNETHAPRFATHRLAPDFSLVVDRALSLPEEVSERVADWWDQQRRSTNVQLFDGNCFSLTALNENVVTLQPMQYRHLLARRKQPALLGKWTDKIRPVGITGVLTCQQGVVLGRRSRQVALEAGLWEPAPAGTLSQTDLRSQLLSELVEELGITDDYVSSWRLAGILEDRQTGIFDIVASIRVDLTDTDIHRMHECHGSAEYDAVRIVSNRTPSSGSNEEKRVHVLPALFPMLEMAGHEIPPNFLK